MGVHAGIQQRGAGQHRLRRTEQRYGAGQAVVADVHDRAVGKLRVKGVGILAGEIARIARRVLAIVDKGFAQPADFRQCLLQRQEIRQIGAFERLEQHHLVFPRAGDQLFRFALVGGQRFFADHVLFMAQE